MPTTFFLESGSRAEPKPNIFINPFAHTTGSVTGYSGANQEGTLATTNFGTTSHIHFSGSATAAIYPIGRFYSPPLEAQTIAAQTVWCNISGFEDLATANAEWEVEVYVWKSDDTGTRGTIGHTNGSFPEMLNDAETETSGSFTSTSLAVSAGDVLCVEVYYNKTAAKAEVTSRLHYAQADVSGYTSRIIFANDVVLYATTGSADQPITFLPLAISEAYNNLPITFLPRFLNYNNQPIIFKPSFLSLTDQFIQLFATSVSEGSFDSLIKLSPQFIQLADKPIKVTPQLLSYINMVIKTLPQFTQYEDSLTKVSPQFANFNEQIAKYLGKYLSFNDLVFQLNATIPGANFSDLLIKVLPQFTAFVDMSSDKKHIKMTPRFTGYSD